MLQVEIFHSVEGDFANGGMRDRGAQARTMEGAARFLADRTAERDFQAAQRKNSKAPAPLLIIAPD